MPVQLDFAKVDLISLDLLKAKLAYPVFQGLKGDKGDKGDTGAKGDAGPAGSSLNAQQQFFSNAGDPNNVVSAPGVLPCQCWDSVNRMTWVKDDGIISNTGWH